MSDSKEISTGPLRNIPNGEPCEAFLGALRVRIPRTKKYTYPDLIVACGELEMEDTELDTLINPTVLIDML